MRSEQFHADRMTGIGGSDAPAVLGFSPWKTPLEVWGEKVGLRPPSEIDFELSYWGHALEGPIARRYCEETGAEITRLGSDLELVRHPVHGCLISHPDAILSHGERGVGVLECKTADYSKTGEWTDEPPLVYQVQLVHNMLVSGATWGALAVLIGGRKFVRQGFALSGYEAPGDFVVTESFVEWLERSLVDWWGSHVVAQVAPPPSKTGSDLRTFSDLVAAKYPNAIELAPEFVNIDRRIAEINETVRGLEAEKESLKALIASAIDENEVGFLPDGHVWKWIEKKRQERIVPAASWRELRRGRG